MRDHSGASSDAIAKQVQILQKTWTDYSDVERVAALSAVDVGVADSDSDLPSVEEQKDDMVSDWWECGDHAWPVRPDVFRD
jgi:hypothetical protein